MDKLPPVVRQDTTGWPVVELQVKDVFLGTFVYDCWPSLTAEQKALPVVELRAKDVLIYTDGPRRAEPLQELDEIVAVLGRFLQQVPAEDRDGVFQLLLARVQQLGRAA